MLRLDWYCVVADAVFTLLFTVSKRLLFLGTADLIMRGSLFNFWRFLGRSSIDFAIVPQCMLIMLPVLVAVQVRCKVSALCM